MTKFNIEAVDEDGKITRVFIHDGYLLPGNQSTKEKAVELAEALVWELNDVLGLDLHG